ncbi:hypothetical protein [Catenuloplanes indicus]|uniref:Uncharacterized protein n=1 Tax=Catenuloplanes indicus TaxID=137267 RepID=A0AAE4AW94_9ACTN|nr:hypothetical protein [Catenuloplanes indicus]MDQ0365700.1 hypothetical protein [Catenuloplanes indicus]
MTDLASLVVQVQRRFADFLATLSNDDMLALAEGRAGLSLTDPAGIARTATPVDAPAAPATKPRAARKATGRSAPKTTGPKRGTPSPHIDHADVANRLRQMDSIDDGSALLTELKPKVDDLKLIAEHLSTRTTGTKTELTNRILTQAIGARLKFAGLRTWD